jgi:hypothetical protein
MMKKIFYSACLATTLFACSEIPKEAFYRRADPETLLDASSEVVNFKVDSDGSIQDMTSWIDKDQPTRAEGCAPSVRHSFEICGFRRQ